MRKRELVFGAAAALLLPGLFLATSAQAPMQGYAPRDAVPAYHTKPPKGAVAPTLPPSQFSNDPITERCYREAARIKGVLYQLPCYCHCDQEMGHNSLLSCFQDHHAAECATCKMELYYAYEQSQRGKTASQIREGVIRGDWQKVDLSKWSAPPHAKPAG